MHKLISCHSVTIRSHYHLVSLQCPILCISHSCLVTLFFTWASPVLTVFFNVFISVVYSISLILIATVPLIQINITMRLLTDYKCVFWLWSHTFFCLMPLMYPNTRVVLLPIFWPSSPNGRHWLTDSWYLKCMASFIINPFTLICNLVDIYLQSVVLFSPEIFSCWISGSSS